MRQSSSTGRGTNAAGRRPTAPANGSAAAPQQQQQRRVAAGGGYPGASTVAQFDVNSGNSQAIPNIGQMQNIFLEGTRPDLARLNNPQRQAAPQAQLQRTFTIRNDVNLKKNSLRLVADEEHSERYHLEFVFDAAAECGITVHYAATEISGEPRPRFVPLKEGTSHPKEYFPKGMGQTFRTRPENALDLALYSAEDLRYDPGVARFPVAILLEAGGPEASSVAHSAVQPRSTNPIPTVTLPLTLTLTLI